jgi:hypothetical protein
MAMENFCRTYQTSNEATSQRNNYQETLVRRGFDSVDNCVSAAQLGFYVSHDLLGPSKAHLTLRAGVGKDIEINGIDTTTNISCTGPVDGKETKYTVATKARSNNTIGVFCTRESRKGPSDIIVFDEGSVAVDITGTKYNFYWPKSEILPEDIASRIQTTLTELRAAQTTLSSKTEEIARRIKMPKDLDHPEVSMFGEFSEGWRDVTCDPGSIMVGLGLYSSRIFAGTAWPGVSYPVGEGKMRTTMRLRAICTPL